MSLRESSRGAEQVLHIVGDEMRPEDTQCSAKIGRGRCKQEITVDEESGYFSEYCGKHLEQQKQARKGDAKRVERA